ncbi:MAG: hypothetical protein V3S69_00490 [Dehalococcoidales bacterium]
MTKKAERQAMTDLKLVYSLLGREAANAAELKEARRAYSRIHDVVLHHAQELDKHITPKIKATEYRTYAK